MTDAAPSNAPRRERPLSPHLQIYRWQLTMAMSILHRVTGAALAVGLLIVTWALVAAASGPDQWDQFTHIATGPFGQLVLFAWSAALYYHLFNGLRHLLWDMGYLFEIRNAYRAGYIVQAATVLALILTWCL